MHEWLGKSLIFVGVLFVLIGLIFLFAPKVPWLGKLPGDIHIRGERFSFYFPLATCLLLSILLTVILNLLLRR